MLGRLKCIGGSILAITLAGSLSSCASGPHSAPAPRHAGMSSGPSSGSVNNATLANLELLLRGRLVATDAVVLHDQGMIRVRVVARALFAPAAPELDGAAAGVLQPLAAALTGYPDATVEIRAYTDSLDPSPAALSLTQQRADAVAAFLVAHGIVASRIAAHGEGQSSPLADDSQVEGRNANRRVEILISALSS